mmetsp:Transcript_23508/g.39309  ORF Transcript_23508/g.39309 Transcript_23508/m.39309 type:complete len:128 (+) Transcript_23508:149-532(+)
MEGRKWNHKDLRVKPLILKGCNRKSQQIQDDCSCESERSTGSERSSSSLKRSRAVMSLQDLEDSRKQQSNQCSTPLPKKTISRSFSSASCDGEDDYGCSFEEAFSSDVNAVDLEFLTHFESMGMSRK